MADYIQVWPSSGLPTGWSQALGTGATCAPSAGLAGYTNTLQISSSASADQVVYRTAADGFAGNTTAIFDVLVHDTQFNYFDYRFRIADTNNNYIFRLRQNGTGVYQVLFIKVVAGVATTGTVLGITGWPSGTPTFRFVTRMVGSSLKLAIRRADNNNWLQAGGTWAAGFAWCQTITDTSLTAAGGSGFAAASSALGVSYDIGTYSEGQAGTPTLTPASATIVGTGTQQLTRTGFSGLALSYASSATAAATTDQNGLVTGVAAGSATITGTGSYDTTETATSAITVTAPLAAGTVTAGATTSTTAAATATAATGGTAPYTYQWYRSTTSGPLGSIVTGQTTLTLADVGLTASTAYYYTLRVTDSSPTPITANSNQVAETTAAGATPLTAGTVTAGTTTSTTAAASATAATGGTAPYSYQWYRSTAAGTLGSAVIGQTTLTLADVGLTASTAYYYTLRVTDSAAPTAAVVSSNQVAETTLAAVAASFTLTAPSPASGYVNQASGNFTVQPNGVETGTFTPTAIAGVTFTPATLTWAGDSLARTFTATPTATGAIAVTGTFSNNLTAPAAVTYTALAVPLGGELASYYRTPSLAAPTVYAVLTRANQAWNGSAFAAQLAANWATYRVGLTDVGATGWYTGNFPTAIGAGTITILYFTGPGVVGDTLIGSQVDYSWDGTTLAPTPAGTTSAGAGVTLAQLNGALAANLAPLFRPTVVAASTTTITLQPADAADAADALAAGRPVAINIATGKGALQDRNLVARVGTTNQFTLDKAWGEVPDPTSGYELIDPALAASSAGAAALTPQQIAAAVWDELQSAHAVAGSFGVGVPIALGQTGYLPRRLDGVADASLTTGDLLMAAACGAVGKELVAGVTYSLSTPATGTLIRSFTLNSATVPTSRS